MNQEHLYDPVGDVLADAISRELPVRLTDLERLELADRKAAAEDELAAHQTRMAEQRRELAKHGEAIARRIADMGTALRERQERRVVVCYIIPHVLVCDEVGYLTYGPDAANVLYHVVTKRHQAHRAMVFTSNKHPDNWGAVLHDDDLAAAIVDRVLERGRLLHLDGPSMRTKHLGRDALVFDEGQPSAAAPAAQPERGRSQVREVPRRHDEDEAPRRNDEGQP